MQEVFSKIIEELEENQTIVFNLGGGKPKQSIDLERAIEIVKQEAEKFGRDTNVESKGNDVLEFANLLKELCCKKDEDYDNPVISPKYLNDTIENLLLDFNEQYNNGWIPCSERLPNQDGEFTDVLITCESIADGVFVQSAEFYIAADGEPVFDALYHYERVLAWMPLPHPYQTKGE